ncbi:homeodomain-like protein [Tanacetum coccineum]
MKAVFNQMEIEVAKCSVHKKYFEIEKKELSLDNDRLLEHIDCQDIMNTAMHANDHSDNVFPANNNSLKHDNSALELCINDYKSMEQSFLDENEENLKLQSELDKKNDIIEKAVYNELLKRCSRLKNRCISLEIKLQQNKESFQTNRPSHNQDALEFKEFFTINELKAQLEAKNVLIEKLKEHIANLKGENVVENNNRDAHVDYLKVTQEYTDTLKGIVEQDKALKLLDNALDYACKYEKRIQELLVCACALCPSSKYVSGKLVAVTPMNRTRKVRFTESSDTSKDKPHKQELHTNTLSGSDHEDVNKHIEKVIEIVDLFHLPNITIDQVMLRAFPVSLTGAASHWLRNEPTASTDAAIRNQGASIKTLEIQIGQMIKYYYEEKKGSYGPQFSEAYSKASHINNSIPRKEKDPGSFTLPCFINNVCFDNALVDLGASVSVMPLSTYLDLGLGELAYTKLTVDLADRMVKYPKGIAENVLVRIVPLILERPFLSIARAKIDVYKRKITLRVGEERIVFTSVKPANSLIKRVYMLSLRERMELDLEARLMRETLVLNRSLDPFFEDYIELNDLNEPFELRRNQGNDLMPTIEEGEVIEEFRTRNDKLNVEINDYPSYCDYNKKIYIDCAHNLKFSCMIGFEFTHANFFPLLYVNVMSKKFHNSIMKEKMVYKGNNVVGALMNVPNFVRTFSVMTNFAVLENMDDYRDE